jgi:hypothetical protein
VRLQVLVRLQLGSGSWLDYLVGQIEGANETIKPMRALTA